MAHNLYKDTMAYTGQEVPWHRKGQHFESAMTAEQVIQGAKLDYKVIKEQLYRVSMDKDGSAINEAVGAYATINQDNNKVLGIVGNRYEPIQNIEAFNFFDEFVGKGSAIYETAGALGDGEKIWLLAKLPNSFAPVAGDRIEQYCCLHNSHDGTSPLSVMFTPIRIVCQNTLNMALKNCANVVRIRHTINAPDRVAEAGRILKNMNEYFTRIGETYHELASFQIDDKFIEEYQDEMFGREMDISDRGPGRSIRLKKIDFFKGRLRNGMGVDIPGVKGTAYWPLQAMVEMSDYDLSKTANAEYVVFGAGADFKQKAFDTALQLVAKRSK